MYGRVPSHTFHKVLSSWSSLSALGEGSHQMTKSESDPSSSLSSPFFIFCSCLSSPFVYAISSPSYPSSLFFTS